MRTFVSLPQQFLFQTGIAEAAAQNANFELCDPLRNGSKQIKALTLVEARIHHRQLADTESLMCGGDGVAQTQAASLVCANAAAFENSCRTSFRRTKSAIGLRREVIDPIAVPMGASIQEHGASSRVQRERLRSIQRRRLRKKGELHRDDGCARKYIAQCPSAQARMAQALFALACRGYLVTRRKAHVNVARCAPGHGDAASLPQ